MKRTLITFAFGLSIPLFFAFDGSYSVKKNTAEVDQNGEIMVFIQSKPVMEYEYLGRVKTPDVVWNGRPKEMINNALKKAPAQFPNCNAVIIYGEQLHVVDAIRIK